MVRSGVEWLHSISYCLVLRMTYYQFNLSEWEASAFNRDTVIRGICWTKENNGDTNISPDLVKLNIKFWNVIAVIASLIKLTICKSNIMPTRSKWFMKNIMNVLSLEYHRSIHALSCPEVKGQLIIFFFFLSRHFLLLLYMYILYLRFRVLFSKSSFVDKNPWTALEWAIIYHLWLPLSQS